MSLTTDKHYVGPNSDSDHAARGLELFRDEPRVISALFIKVQGVPE